MVLGNWCNALMLKFPKDTPPTALYLGVLAKHHIKYDIYLVSGPNFYGVGENREQLAEYVLSTADAQFRQILNDGHCSALIRVRRRARRAAGHELHGGRRPRPRPRQGRRHALEVMRDH